MLADITWLFYMEINKMKIKTEKYLLFREGLKSTLKG